MKQFSRISIILFSAILLFASVGFTSTASAQTIKIKQKWSKLKLVKNKKGYDMNLDKTTANGRNGYGHMNASLDQVQINSYETAGRKIGFNTYAWLPFLDDKYNSSIRSNKPGNQLSNPQSFALLNDMIYTVWSTGSNKGYITKFPKNLPGGMQAKNNDFRSAYWYKYNNSPSYANNGYQSAGADDFFNQMSISGLMTIGHGQTLSTDGQNLYMLRDTDYKHANLRGTGKSIKLYKYDANLNTVQHWSFKLRNSTSKYEYNPHTLAMVDANHFYLGIVGNLSGNYKASYIIFKGTINGNKVSVKPAFRVKQKVGKYLQSITYSRALNRLYLVGDNSFVGVDLGNYQSYSTKIVNNTRETEGMTFDGADGYLLFNSYPELVKGSFY
jgi:hypothetical protein